MSKINNQKRITKMILSLAILVTLTMSAISMIPKEANAQICWNNNGGTYCDYNYYNNGYYNNGYYNNNYNYNYNNYSYNPTPILNKITPPSLPSYTESNVTINLTGDNFLPTSLAKFNNSGRPTTFIDRNHLTITLNGYDFQNTGSYAITVFNPAPGGGTSNIVYFTVTNSYNNAYYQTPTTKTITKVVYVPVPANSSNTSTNTNYYSNTPANNNSQNNNTQPNTNTNAYSNLAANAVFGTNAKNSNSFWPSGLIQWLLFAIMISIIVLLVRKIYVGKYYSAPLKHE